MSSKVPPIILNNGVEMPQLGFGVWQVPDAEAETAVTTALEAGCLFSIDTDAHAPGQLDWLRFGCVRAAMCGVPAERVRASRFSGRRRHRERGVRTTRARRLVERARDPLAARPPRRG